MSLRDDPFIQDLKENMQDKIAGISNSVASGSMSSFDQYKFNCGKIEGLRIAIDLIDATIKSYTNDDSDDD